MQVTIYHNPRCAKSREALHLIRDREIDPNIIEYLQEPPTAADLKKLVRLLGVPTRDILRAKEVIYQQLGLEDPTLTDEQLIDAIVKNPILLERPIVVVDNKAIIARPGERVLEIL